MHDDKLHAASRKYLQGVGKAGIDIGVLVKRDWPPGKGGDLEFIHNQQGHDFLSNQDSQVKMARALSDGILDHFEITHTAFPPDRNTDVGFSAGTKQEDNAKIIARIRADLDTLEKRLT